MALLEDCLLDMKPEQNRYLLSMADTMRIIDGASPITVWREKRGLKLTELANAVGLAGRDLAMIESGGLVNALRGAAPPRTHVWPQARHRPLTAALRALRDWPCLLSSHSLPLTAPEASKVATCYIVQRPDRSRRWGTSIRSGPLSAVEAVWRIRRITTLAAPQYGIERDRGKRSLIPACWFRERRGPAQKFTRLLPLCAELSATRMAACGLKSTI